MVNAYNSAVQRLTAQRAEMLISEIESLKQIRRKSIDFNECSAPADDAALAAWVLQMIKVPGVTLTGIPATDAHTLGFADISVGTVDTVGGNGAVTIPGIPARITLRNGVVVTSASH